MAEEEKFGEPDTEVDEEIKRIEDELDSQPGLIDFDRVGKTMVILGTVFFVSYIALFLLSTMVQVEESWGAFNFMSVSQFVVVNITCIAMIIVGYLMITNRSIPS